MQLALCLYRLAHGCAFGTDADLSFDTVGKVIVRRLSDRFVSMANDHNEWKRDCANEEFRCVRGSNFSCE